MTFKLPDKNQITKLAQELGLKLGDAQAETLLEYMQPFAGGYEYLDQVDDELPKSLFQNRSFHIPDESENQLGAWLVKCNIKGADSGPLHGKKVVIKDNIYVADLPLTNGSSALKGLTADFDAVTVDRVLRAGGEIVGKSVCEYMCLSGGSATSSSGIVQNARKPGYSTGGSSSGSATLVAAGEVDLGLGTDQGGSVRIPASWCGVVGMKATRDVVPFTGGVPIETSIDYIGPLTRQVSDNAIALEVLANNDDAYTKELDIGVKDLKIAVLKEGFNQEASDPEVDKAVQAAAKQFESLGATISEVSIPEHMTGLAIWGAIVTDGFWQALKLNGLGYNYESIYSPALYQIMADWTTRIDDAPINAKLLWLLGGHMDSYHGKYYAKAKNLVHRLSAAYDAVLSEYDLLLMPTTVQRACKNPEDITTASDDEIMATAFGNTFNTAQFNSTGHPGISIPCGVRDDLPIGLMLIGKHYAEAKIYQAAYAYEQSTDWQKL